jgi:hypothetical protein
MLKRIEQMNRDIWSGHSRLLQDVTHVVGGIGLGMLLSPRSLDQGRPLGMSLVVLSTVLHLYAAVVKPPLPTPPVLSRVGRLRRLAAGAVDGNGTGRAVGGRLKALARAVRSA